MTARTPGTTAPEPATPGRDSPEPDGPEPLSPGPASPELDFLTFPEHAVAEAGRRIPALDLDAMRLVLLLHRVSSALVYDLESAVHRPAGWSWSGFRLLFPLWISGPIDGKTAAALSGMSRAAVSNLAKTLERDGLVSRAPDPADARAVVLSLSPLGEEALRATFRAHNQRETAWAATLEEGERRTLTALLTKLADAAHSDWVRRRG